MCVFYFVCQDQVGVLAENVVHEAVEAVAERRQDALVRRRRRGGTTAAATAAAEAGLGRRGSQLGTILRLGGLDGPVVGTVVALRRFRVRRS